MSERFDAEVPEGMRPDARETWPSQELIESYLNGQVLALTPISAFRPRRWRGALLPHDARVTIEVLEADKRPVSAVADNFEVRDVMEVHISEHRDQSLVMLFDAGRSLEERVLAEQFSA